MNTTAIILAAGQASRMQLRGAYKSKALLPLPYHAAAASLPGQPAPWLPALDCLTQTYRQAGISTILLVCGFHHAETETRARALGLTCVRNTAPEEGMFSSVRAALCAMPACDNFFVQPVDVPLVTASSIETLLQRAAAAPGVVLLPAHAGRTGHPPLIPALFRQTILSHDGNGGLAGALQGMPLEAVPVADPFVLEDMDTPRDYANLCLLAGPQLCLVRHGALAPNPQRRFVGRQDLPLSPRGHAQLQAVAHDLEDFLCSPHLAAILCSSLQRSRASAAILLEHARTLGRKDLPLHADTSFDEISLGRWEGLTPGEVRARFPGGYEARGRDVAAFAPEGGECFARVQERALAALARWREQYAGKSLLLVAHAGVNRCLLAQHMAMPLSAFAHIQDFLRMPQAHASHAFIPLT